MASRPGAERRARDAIARLGRELLPPPRRELRWSSVWTLALAALLTGIGIPACVLTHVVSFSGPWQLCWLAALPWVWWLGAAGWSGMGRGRAATALLVRMGLIIAIALALAGPRAVRGSDHVNVIFALDCSDSIGEDMDARATDWIASVASGKRAKDSAGLVVFGQDAAVEIPARQNFVFDAISSRIVRDGTDIANALALASASLPQDGPGRIVLISDGTATQGDTERMVDQLAARGVPVDVLPVSYEHTHEVWLERIDLPREVHAHETYQAGIVLGSLMAGKGTLVLTENGRRIAEQPVSYEAGKSRFTVPLTVREAGYYEYAATIEPEPGGDTWPQNNTVLGSITLRGTGHILLVYGDGADPRTWQRLADVLRSTGRIVQAIASSRLPQEPEAFGDDDVVALVDVPADALNRAQQLAVRDAVQNLGVGLLMIGGENGFGPGGWNHTPVEDALPVTMESNQRKVLPKGALAIIIEMSEFPDGDGWAKTITKQAMRVLSAKDDVGVLTSGMGGDQWIFPLQPAGDYNKLAPLVDGAFLGDMPSFDSIMGLALEGLKADDAALKHLIVMSDGDCMPPSPGLLKRFREAGIPVSTVLIVPDGPQDIELMKQIARATGGRSYYPSSPQGLPAVFIKEAKTIKRSELQNISFTPAVSFPSPILKDLGPMPQLRGYTLVTAKPHSQVVLRGPEKETEDPVLSSWRFGLGSSAAWTSDLSTNWAADWQQWPHYKAFIDQLFTALARTQTKSQLVVSVDSEDGKGVILVEDRAQGEDFLTVNARMVDPAGAGADLDVPQVAPGRYRATFPLAGVGRYHLAVAAAGGPDGSRDEHALATLTVSYSGEYQRFRPNPQVLEGIARRTKGRVLKGTEDGDAIYGVERHPVYTSRPVLDWALALVAMLLPLDVAVRRVSIDPAMLLGMLMPWRRRRAESTSTMSALLGRKTAISLPKAELRPQPPLVRARAALAHPAAPAATGAAARTAAAVKPASPGPDLGTTGKLLEARRRREQEGKT